MSKPNLAKVLYAAISVALFEYVWVMALHANDRIEYLKISGIPARFASSVYFGTIAVSVVCQVLMAFFISAAWVPSRLTRLRLRHYCLSELWLQFRLGLRANMERGLSRRGLYSPQLLVLFGGWRRLRGKFPRKQRAPRALLLMSVKHRLNQHARHAEADAQRHPELCS